MLVKKKAHGVTKPQNVPFSPPHNVHQVNEMYTVGVTHFMHYGTVFTLRSGGI